MSRRRNMARRSGLGVVGALGLALLSCRTSVPEGELVAKVNGEGISKADFDSTVTRMMAKYRSNDRTLPPGIEQRIRESVLRRMIDDKVISLRAKKEKIVVVEAELEQQFDDHRKRFRSTEVFQQYLERSGSTAESMKDELRRKLLRDQVVEKLSGSIEVTAGDVQKYYDDNRERFARKEQIRASRILIRVNKDASDSQWKKAEERLKTVRLTATKSGADFGALAKEKSEGPEKDRNGTLGWMTRKRMPAEFDQAAFALQADEVSQPVRTRLGWEIIKVHEKRAEEQQPLSEVQSTIERSLKARKKNEKRRKVLQGLKTEAKIEQLIEFTRPAIAPARAPHGVGLKNPRFPPGGVPGGVAAPAASSTAVPAPAPSDK